MGECLKISEGTFSRKWPTPTTFLDPFALNRNLVNKLSNCNSRKTHRGINNTSICMASKDEIIFVRRSKFDQDSL